MLTSRSPILASALSLAVILTSFSLTARSQTASPPEQKLDLNVAVVLDPDLCATKIKKNHETFEVGRAACDLFKSALEQGFSSVTSVATTGDAAGAQVILVPRFVDLSATKTMGAFSTRELTVLLEWTAKDKSGRTVWIETVQGAGKNHMGNGFTYKTDLKEIIHYAVEDLAHKSVAEMDASPELRKLAQKLADAK
ncbi:MAG: hypothetical protein ABR987_19620 [Terracidiphilus sp.]|jgi:hypothetical protein